MRTETITREIFTFEELSEEAKQKAIENYRNEMPADTSYYWDEARESVKGFHSTFGSEEGRSSWLDIRTDGIEDNALELSGQRLRTYLLNNYEGAFFERKSRGHSKDDHRSEEKPRAHRLVAAIRKDHKGKCYRVFRSNFIVESCCPFTGVCYDEDLLQPFKDFIKNPDKRTFEDLLTEAVNSLRKSLENEDEYRNSDEAITEDIEANGHEFLEDGELA
jgi:hypothetical protein